jgi:hypothetical protein
MAAITVNKLVPKCHAKAGAVWRRRGAAAGVIAAARVVDINAGRRWPDAKRHAGRCP